jgi:hypothetical protein
MVNMQNFGRKDILNCDVYFFQNWREEILEIALGVAKQGNA